jgi:hypothetical protein
VKWPKRTKRQRWVAGWFYLGCFAPFGYAMLLVWNILHIAGKQMKQGIRKQGEP